MLNKAICVIIALSIISYLISTVFKLETENKRLNNNIEVLNSDITTFENKNGDLTTIIKSLELRTNELKTYNDSLVKDLEASNVKVKNLTFALQLKVEPKVEIKEVIIEKEYMRNDSSVFIINEYDDYFKLTGKAIVPHDLKILKLEDLNFELTNVVLSIGNETQYKGIWFWKRIVGYKTTVVCKNKYFNITETKSFNFK